MSQLEFDPWTRVRTVHDFAADEVISALQKEIRRGHTQNAALLALEMLDTSPELERKLWDRLFVISVEDIGFGEVHAPILIQTLEQMSQRFTRGMGDRDLFAIHAVRYLCTRQKDRGSDEMLNWLRQGVDRGELRPMIPDYAIDMHTARGIERGRGLRHFLEEGAQINPELPDRETQYREWLLQALEISEGGAAEENS